MQKNTSRRTFLKTGGVIAGGWLALPAWARNKRMIDNFPIHNIPVDKGLSAQWVKSLYETGKPTVYLKSKNELQFIGMPAGGLHSGTLYFGGDGRLWLWEIYNDNKAGANPKTVIWNNGIKDLSIDNMNGANYVSPAISDNLRVLSQGFAVMLTYNGQTIIKQLREEDWDEVAFEATYPLAKVTYTSKSIPVKVILTGGAFFIPLSIEESELPATSINIQVENISSRNVEVSLTGWLENGANKISAKANDGQRINEFVQGKNYEGIFYSFNGNDDFAKQKDAGTMCFVRIGKDSTINTASNPFLLNNHFFIEENNTSSSKNADEIHTASITNKKTILFPDKSIDTDYIISWHFNHTLDELHDRMPESKDGYHYATLYKNAKEIIDYAAENFDHLKSMTRLWQKIYYDSTLPHWLLERSIINIGTVATANTYRFASGRFWSWEGVNACPGTCTHVWQYGHTMARIFPELERDTRQRVDLGVAYREDGSMGFRAEFDTRPAIDGQAGTILRFYREHQMSPDYTFLKNNWSKIKQTVSFMLAQDKNGDGMTDTPLDNTLDAVWSGEISWIVGLCIAAAKAAQMMAAEIGDSYFETTCRNYVEKGSKSMAEQLFNGEYFIHRPDPVEGRKNLGSYNTCHIDQVYGQSWAFQVGLGRLWDKEKTLSALRSLWKYNFTTDVGPYIKTHSGGRPYALEGDGGMIMNTNPHNEPKPYGENVTWQGGYFHECMSGFEHQVAAHMMAEGMIDEALVLTRAIHDRYSAAKRNPYNEIECSDHYARAMASYGTFIAACGFEYHGPKGYIAFKPKMSPENFKAPFTAAEGWGSYRQEYNNNGMSATYKIEFGRLKLKSIGLSAEKIITLNNISVVLNQKKIPCTYTRYEDSITIFFKDDITLTQKDSLFFRLS